MNRRIMSIFIFCFLYFTLCADTWLQTYDPFDEAIFNVEDVVICTDGGYAINGTCINQQTTIGWGFVIKTDSNGNMLWAKRDTVSFQPENDSRAFVETEDGGFLSSSYFWGNGTALIKRDNVGEIEDSILLEDIAIHSMCNTNDGNIALAGHNYVNYQTDDWPCLIKTNQDTEIIWEQIYEFDYYEWGVIKSVIQSSDNGFLLTGSVYDIETEDAILVIKTNALGDTLWTRTLDVTDEDDKAKTIIETDEGDIFIGGYLEGISAGFLWKLDSDGNTSWFEYGTVSCGYGFTSFIKSNDNCIISIFGDLVFDNSIRKFDSDYNIEWTNNLPYFAGHGDKSVKTTSENNIVVALYNPPYVGLIKLNPDGTDINEEQIMVSKTVFKTYPNPFNPSTSISFDVIKDNSKITLSVLNIKGQKVITLFDGYKSFGEHTVIWNANNIDSGVYIFKLKVNNTKSSPNLCVNSSYWISRNFLN